jgi:very-long-chain ceramide synthase
MPIPLHALQFYYLVQGGFWMHQLLVLNLEAKRKDYEQMFAHHIITIALLVSSYVTNFHRIGNAILCLMDPSDILLSVSAVHSKVMLQMADCLPYRLQSA